MIASTQTLRQRRPVTPFVERSVVHGLSYGLSGAGYDIRCREDVLLWPRSYRLASSVETFTMPHDLLGIVHDKSTWARQKVTVQNTVIEPGWCGVLTLELANHSYGWRRIRAGEPIAQVVFHLLDVATERPYTGKYQYQQAGPQRARWEHLHG